MSNATLTTAKPLSPWLHEIPVGAAPGMRVPARVFADEVLWERMQRDRSLEQLLNVATLPGVEEAVYAMPDAHEGYGFPVGGVAAMRMDDGVISPGGVGYDINCGVRLLMSELTQRDLADRLEPLVHDLSRSIPSGGYANPHLRLSAAEVDRVLKEGSRYLVERGLATAEDLEHTEAAGSLAEADPLAVSSKARERGHDQLGTIGSGNHFVEVEVVDEIYDSSRRRGVRPGAGAGRTAHPHRLARSRTPGLYRPCAADGRGDGALRHRDPRPPARVRAAPLP